MATATTINIKLRRNHRTAAAFLDETGIIAKDRFFAVGCLILPEPHEVLRKVQKLRDRRHWYGEIKWVDLTMTSLSLYKALIDIAATSAARYSCFVSDRDVADPVARFSNDPWLAYQKLASQLLIGSVRPFELLSVMIDNYSTPDQIVLEKEIRDHVNSRLGCLAATTVCRLDSKSSDGLQLVDVLTGAVAFEYRQDAGLAGSRGAKARAATHLRNAFGVATVLGGCRTTSLNVAVYRNPTQAQAALATQPSA
ncbi:MAG: DUF3800 domain-containing protein [Gaiellaceae bacterium]